MPALDPCFSGMAAGAQRLQVAGVVGQLWVRSDWLDVIHLEPPAATAGTAAITITLKDLCPKGLPAFCAGYLAGKPLVFFSQAHSSRAFL